MNKTTQYQLNQWEPEDQVRRTDFNEDNAKLDAALTGLERGKADASTLTAVQAEVAGVKTALAGKGTCTMKTGTYTGTGAKTASLYLGSPLPKLLIVSNGIYRALFVPGVTSSVTVTDVSPRLLSVTWSSTGLSWYESMENNPIYALNKEGTAYHYFAFY